MTPQPPRSTLFPYSTFFVFFFNDTATTEIYTLSLHDALPIWCRDTQTFDRGQHRNGRRDNAVAVHQRGSKNPDRENHMPRGQSTGAATALHHRHECEDAARSEEHTSELQSHSDIVCRLLLEKK